MEAEIIPIREQTYEYEVRIEEQSCVSVQFDFNESTTEEWAKKTVAEQLQGFYEAGYRKVYEDCIWTLEEDPEYWSGYTIEVDLVKDVEANPETN